MEAQRQKQHRGRKVFMPRVLVVEDDIDLLTLYLEVFEKEGFQGTYVRSAAEGMYYALSHARYRAVVFDVALPEYDAFHIITQMREKNIQTPVFVVTGMDTELIRAKADEYAHTFFVPKPIKMHDLIGLIREHVDI